MIQARLTFELRLIRFAFLGEERGEEGEWRRGERENVWHTKNVRRSVKKVDEKWQGMAVGDRYSFFLKNDACLVERRKLMFEILFSSL